MAEVVPNRGMDDFPNRGRIYAEGVPRGRADTPGFYRQPEIEGQQVTEFGVLPLPRTNTFKMREVRIFGAGLFAFLGLFLWIFPFPILPP